MRSYPMHHLDTAGAHISLSNKADYENDCAAIRAVLGEEAFEAARREGRGVTSNEAVEKALEGLGVEVDPLSSLSSRGQRGR